MKKVIIIGAGPAGLTAGYDLLSKSSDYDVTIIEESPVVGGLCARLDGARLAKCAQCLFIYSRL